MLVHVYIYVRSQSNCSVYAKNAIIYLIINTAALVYERWWRRYKWIVSPPPHHRFPRRNRQTFFTGHLFSVDRVEFPLAEIGEGALGGA